MTACKNQVASEEGEQREISFRMCHVAVRRFPFFRLVAVPLFADHSHRLWIAPVSISNKIWLQQGARSPREEWLSLSSRRVRTVSRTPSSYPSQSLLPTWNEYRTSEGKRARCFARRNGWPEAGIPRFRTESSLGVDECHNSIRRVLARS